MGRHRLRARHATHFGIDSRQSYLCCAKTERRRRNIALPASILSALRVHKVKQNEARLAVGATHRDLGLVFADAIGEPWKPGSIATLFRGIAKRAGIGHLRFRDLRHSAAWLLIERGVPVTTVSEMLGHANSAITLSIYAHSVKGAEARAALMMDGLLKGVETAW
jgi:integrase